MKLLGKFVNYYFLKVCFNLLLHVSDINAVIPGRNDIFGVYLNPYDPLSRLASLLWESLVPPEFQIAPPRTVTISPVHQPNVYSTTSNTILPMDFTQTSTNTSISTTMSTQHSGNDGTPTSTQSTIFNSSQTVANTVHTGTTVQQSMGFNSSQQPGLSAQQVPTSQHQMSPPNQLGNMENQQPVGGTRPPSQTGFHPQPLGPNTQPQHNPNTVPSSISTVGQPSQASIQNMPGVSHNPPNLQYPNQNQQHSQPINPTVGQNPQPPILTQMKPESFQPTQMQQGNPNLPGNIPGFQQQHGQPNSQNQVMMSSSSQHSSSSSSSNNFNPAMSQQYGGQPQGMGSQIPPQGRPLGSQPFYPPGPNYRPGDQQQYAPQQLNYIPGRPPLG